MSVCTHIASLSCEEVNREIAIRRLPSVHIHVCAHSPQEFLGDDGRHECRDAECIRKAMLRHPKDYCGTWEDAGPLIEAARITVHWYSDMQRWGANTPQSRLYTGVTAREAAARAWLAANWSKE